MAPTLTNETDLKRLAASLRADRPRRERRRVAGAAAFASHLDYIGNARGVADAFLRELSVARGRRAALEAQSVPREPARLPGLHVDGGGGARCPTVALLTGHGTRLDGRPGASPRRRPDHTGSASASSPSRLVLVQPCTLITRISRPTRAVRYRKFWGSSRRQQSSGLVKTRFFLGRRIPHEQRATHP